MDTPPTVFSIIIPVYNRPDEVRELLESLLIQTNSDFEVIIVEDGSSVCCDKEVDRVRELLRIQYVRVPNGGPAAARNIGARIAVGEYLLILDSDVVLPSGYIAAVKKRIEQMQADAFGGPDAAAEGFSPIQKAINYAMTSFFTTGGIRGGRSRRVRLDKFYPRSFNLGCKLSVYRRLGGFSEEMRFGEDIDFSLRLFKAGYNVYLFPEAVVFHKRRIDFKKFFRQVYNSGIARIHLQRRHPGSMKPVHILPALFTLGSVILAVGQFFCPWSLLPLLLLALLFLLDAWHTNRSLRIAILAVPASFVQLWGYGSGFLVACWRCYVLGHQEFRAFDKTFYN